MMQCTICNLLNLAWKNRWVCACDLEQGLSMLTGFSVNDEAVWTLCEVNYTEKKPTAGKHNCRNKVCSRIPIDTGTLSGQSKTKYICLDQTGSILAWFWTPASLMESINGQWIQTHHKNLIRIKKKKWSVGYDLAKCVPWLLSNQTPSEYFKSEGREMKSPPAKSSWQESSVNNGRTSLHRSVQDWYPCPGGFSLSLKITAAIQKICLHV